MMLLGVATFLTLTERDIDLVLRSQQSWKRWVVQCAATKVVQLLVVVAVECSIDLSSLVFWVIA